MTTPDYSQMHGIDPDSGGTECIPGRPDAGVIIFCDHAKNWVPPELHGLGLPAGQLERHIGYDIGAAGVARALAARLGVPAILSGASRLVIDPNRGLDDPTLIMQVADGAVVPGNRGLSADAIADRIARFYQPYHAAIAATIAAARAAGHVPALVSIHSFTPQWRGVPRPWPVTVLWDRDPRLPLPLIAALGAITGADVGENVPYTGKLKGDCLYTHGTSAGLPHALIELRQDLIADAAGQALWAGHLANALVAVRADPATAAELDCVRHFGSWTDEPGF